MRTQSLVAIKTLSLLLCFKPILGLAIDLHSVKYLGRKKFR